MCVGGVGVWGEPISKDHTLYMIPFIQYSRNDRIRDGDRLDAKGEG